MALNARQQTQADELKKKLEDYELTLRKDMPASFQMNGNFFLQMFRELRKQVKEIENA